MQSHSGFRSRWASFAQFFGMDEDEAKALALAPLVISLFAVLFFRINGCDDSEQAAAAAAAVEPMLDTDGDGVFDVNDGCPTIVANTTSGCPSDADGDGVLDKDDKCPNVHGTQSDGCQPAPDSDGDGVVDTSDQCPKLAGNMANGCKSDRDGDGVFDDEDGCPEVVGDDRGCPRDADGDGVPDTADACPSRKGLKEKAGCPGVNLSANEREALELAVKSVKFKTASATLTQASVALVDRVADVLLNHPELKLTVEGHTDNVGAPDRNLALSKRRAEACVQRIVARGIPASRITAVGFGQSKPVVPNDSPANRKRNRRVEFELR